MSCERRVGKRAEQKRRWDAENRATCACGAAMARASETCRACANRAKAKALDERRKEIVAMWADGATLREIGERFGWPTGRTRYEFGKARAAGYDLPYRHRGYPKVAA